MTHVYIVRELYWEMMLIHKVFDSKEKAMKYVETAPESYIVNAPAFLDIEEWEIE